MPCLIWIPEYSSSANPLKSGVFFMSTQVLTNSRITWETQWKFRKRFARNVYTCSVISGLTKLAKNIHKKAIHPWSPTPQINQFPILSKIQIRSPKYRGHAGNCAYKQICKTRARDRQKVKIVRPGLIEMHSASGPGWLSAPADKTNVPSPTANVIRFNQRGGAVISHFLAWFGGGGKRQEGIL